MSAGTEVAEPTPPAIPIEQLIRNKVMVLKLTSGEYLMGIAMQDIDSGINLAYPYEVVTRAMELQDRWIEVPVLVKHCPFAKNRVFFLPWSHMIYAKEVTENFANIYVEQFQSNEPTEYSSLVTAHETNEKNKLERKTIILMGGSSVKVDANKIIVSGNETRH